MRVFKSTILLCLIAFFAIISPSCFASDDSTFEKTVTLDGKEYKYSELIEDFSNVAISKSYYKQFFETKGQKFLSNLNGVDEIWHDLLFPMQSYKSSSVGIHKWDQPVNVSVQWPLGEKVDANIDNDPTLETLIKSQVNSILPELESASNLSISYLDPKDETRNDWARVRIVYRPVLCDSLEQTVNFFKTQKCVLNIHPMNRQAYYTSNGFLESLPPEYRKNIVPFTPLSRSQVDGFLINDENGNVKFAACFLWKFHDENLLRAMVSECMLRALGLTDISKNENSILGNWNKVYDPYSFHWPLDEERYEGDFYAAKLKFKNAILNKAISYSPTEEWLESEYLKKVQALLNRENVDVSARFETNEYDLFLLRTLYRTDVKVGSSTEELETILKDGDY